jgi:hypothetical protein
LDPIPALHCLAFLLTHWPSLVIKRCARCLLWAPPRSLLESELLHLWNTCLSHIEPKGSSCGTHDVYPLRPFEQFMWSPFYYFYHGNLEKIRKCERKKKSTNKITKPRHSACQFTPVTCTMYSLTRTTLYSSAYHDPNPAVSSSYHNPLVYMERISVFSRNLSMVRGPFCSGWFCHNS